GAVAKSPDPDINALSGKCRNPACGSRPWPRRCSGLIPHREKVIGYIRYTDDPFDAGRQLELMQTYCASQGFRLVKVFEDAGAPSTGLSRALSALKEADALIAVDLDRFVEHEGDNLRDLRPFIHDFFEFNNKHLITIREGIDTGSPNGQMDILELMN